MVRPALLRQRSAQRCGSSCEIIVAAPWQCIVRWVAAPLLSSSCGLPMGERREDPEHDRTDREPRREMPVLCPIDVKGHGKEAREEVDLRDDIRPREDDEQHRTGPSSPGHSHRRMLSQVPASDPREKRSGPSPGPGLPNRQSPSLRDQSHGDRKAMAVLGLTHRTNGLHLGMTVAPGNLERRWDDWSRTRLCRFLRFRC
jgi:hypothetical protein